MARSTSCKATKRNGEPCGSAVVLASGYCFLHDPDRRSEARTASARGGQGKSRIARLDRLVPASLKPTIGLLFTALEETHAGTLDPRQAGAMAALAGAISRLYASGILEERLAALEAATATVEGRRA